MFGTLITRRMMTGTCYGFEVLRFLLVLFSVTKCVPLLGFRYTFVSIK